MCVFIKACTDLSKGMYRHLFIKTCTDISLLAEHRMSASNQCQPALTHAHTHARTRTCTYTHTQASWYTPAGGGCTFGLWGAFGLLQVSTVLRTLVLRTPAACQRPLHLPHASMAGSHSQPFAACFSSFLGSQYCSSCSTDCNYTLTATTH